MTAEDLQTIPVPLDEQRASLLRHLHEYARQNADERDVAELFVDFVSTHPDCLRRELAVGHLTTSAWLVDAQGRQALLLHHRKLDRWLQPGGHADGDPDLARSALREAKEETGIEGLTVAAAIFDLDRHRIPARGHEIEHWHHDVRFVVRAPPGAQARINHESRAMAWRDIDALAEEGDLDPSIRRMARKWLAQASLER